MNVHEYSQPFARLPSRFHQFGWQPLNVQLLALQPTFECGYVTLQSLPHAPQLSGLFPLLISQPSLVMPLQFANVPMHELITQPPPEQAGFAFARLHALPQPPQFWTSVFVEISQPSPFVLLQSAKPDEHATMLQLPLAQVSLAFARLQTLPQPPQFERLDEISVSQPYAAVQSA